MALISGLEDPLDEGTTTRSSILAWRIPWTEEPGALQSMGSQRVRHDLETKQQEKQDWHVNPNKYDSRTYVLGILHCLGLF